MTQWISIGIAVMLLLLTIELLRREKLTFKYAISWLSGCLVAVFFGINRDVVMSISNGLGFEIPSNFIFLGLFCLLLFMSLLMTVFLSQQSRRNDQMAQQIGLLKHDFQQLKHSLKEDKNV